MSSFQKLLIVQTSEGLFECDRYLIKACRNEGADVDVFVAADQISMYRLSMPLNWRTGFTLLAPVVLNSLRKFVGKKTYDAVFVLRGEAVCPKAVKFLASVSRQVFNLNNDDPFGGRDGNRWITMLKALPHYHRYVTFRECNVSEALSAGAPSAQRIWFAYDPGTHSPVGGIRLQVSDVVIVGTWMNGRGEIARKLVESGLDVKIYGDKWNRAPEWGAIAHRYAGKAVYGREYARAIASGSVAIGFVSHGNRDQHTTRSFEIPAIGTFLLAERTEEHSRMYVSGREADFWDSADECVEKSVNYIRNLPDTCREIATRGFKKVRSGGATYSDRFRQIVEPSPRDCDPFVVL